jgi:HEAT repeat protein
MRFSLISLSIFLSLLTSHLNASSFETNRVLFLMSQGKVDDAIDLYRIIEQSTGKQDFELLQRIGLILLDQGIKSSEPEKQLTAIFGAGISTNDCAFYLFEEGLRSTFPQIQAVALNLLGRTQTDEAFELIHRMMGSPYALIRLEAAYQLALIKHPQATAQIEALMQKIDPIAIPLFPRLFALIGDNASLKILRKLLSNSDNAVRVAAIHSAVEFGRDDLLPQIRKLATQPNATQQEAAALALGAFQDTSSLDLLKRLCKSQHGAVQIAALSALYRLGVKEAAYPLVAIAKQGNLFAIQALAEIPGSEEVLVQLTQHPQVHVRLNASLILLEHKDRRALPGITSALVQDAREYAYAKIVSPGKALSAWKAIPSASHQGEEAQMLQELSLAFREELLENALTLPAEDFLKLAQAIFQSKQNDLVPLLIRLIVNLDTEEAAQLLKHYQQQTGAPLIRQYAALGLVKMKEEGPYVEALKSWVMAQQGIEILQFRPFLPADQRDPLNTYEMTPQESARLLVEALEVFAEEDDTHAIPLLLQALQQGHPHNRPVIAGLMLKYIQ